VSTLDVGFIWVMSEFGVFVGECLCVLFLPALFRFLRLSGFGFLNHIVE
jgi:hypothetical protein